MISWIESVDPLMCVPDDDPAVNGGKCYDDGMRNLPICEAAQSMRH